jgi:hypothetical protein
VKRHYCAVWHAEYPEEGSLVFLARNASEAKRKAKGDEWFGHSPLSAARMTREAFRTRALEGSK